MAHHKRKGPKSTRAGCLMCKPHKRQGWPYKEREPLSVRRKDIEMAEERPYSGILSCFFQGFSHFLFFSVRSALIRRRRVLRGWMTSSI